jgi:glutathione synthase/RimK-type ligase-like ATP-grasp enzyme
MKIGLITSDYNELEKYEISEIIKYMKLYFDEYTIFDLSTFQITISDTIEVFCNIDDKKVNLNSYDVILIRKTRGKVEQILDIITALSSTKNAPLILDLPESFNKPTSKINPLINRSKFFIQPKTEIILNIQNEIKNTSLKFPIICKPTHGTGGTDIKICNNIAEINIYRKQYLNTNNKSGYGLILQEYINFDEEYRVITINGKSIGSVIKQTNKKIKNANKGATFILKNNLKVNQLAEEVSKFQKLFFAGVDIIKKDNIYYILECNRNPGFNAFDIATNQNTAKLLIEEIYHIAKKQ